MFDAVDWGSFWEWGAPDAEVCAYFVRTGPDAYTRYTLQMIRTGKKGQKEDELGLVNAPNYSSEWVVWLDWINAANMPLPKLDDYFVDAQGAGWSVVAVNQQLRQQVVVLKNCCSMNAPYPAGT